jgi:protein dithiol oxidoreductase (disulfide-forming)
MTFRKLLQLAAAAWIAAAGIAAAQQPPFTMLNPPQPTEPGKIEVVEFFWYACPHCYHLEPAVATWTRNAPKDVVFKRMPAASGSWDKLASVYFTLEAMGILDQYHAKVFDAIHKQNINLAQPDVREPWLAKQGIDVAKYKDVEKSFAVMTKVQRAKQMSASYKVDAVPMLVVDGKYVVTAQSAGGQERMFQAVDVAIAAARREKGMAAAPAPEVAKR